MSSPLDFTGRVALITGGSRGIGRGIAEVFLASGADVAVCGRKAPDELPGAGGKSAIFVGADVRDPEQVEKMVDEVTERLGRLDVLVNNAGGAPFAEAATVSPRFSEKIVQLNLTAALHCAQQANRVMQRQDTGGSIINIASVSGVRPSPGTAAYGAAKAGLINLSGTLAIEWGPKVRVNAISASMILTEQAHFASPLASYVSGANLLLHGGGETPAFLSAATVNRGE
jgi:NAD(P)-dependent dehydrogenase (short-subunit alcohol dehydrogenase family)